MVRRADRRLAAGPPGPPTRAADPSAGAGVGDCAQLAAWAHRGRAGERASGGPRAVAGVQALAGALETITHYLHLLEEAYLIAALPKHAARAIRRRAAPPKLVALNQALLAATAVGGVPTQEREPDRFGKWVENACLAFAWNAAQRVSYWREEPWEVDGVVDGSWGRWAIEVKPGRLTPADLAGLLQFVTRFPAYRPLVACDPSLREVATRAGVQAMSWQDFLWAGPPPREE